MNNILDQKIGDLAIRDYSFIQLFQKYKVDFYCKGNLTLDEGLRNAKINSHDFLNELEKIRAKNSTEYKVKIEEWPLDLLADYLQKKHHRFTDQILVKLKKKVDEYLTNNSGEKENISAFKVHLELLAKELGGHMKKEELILFPYIRKMVVTRGKIEAPRFKSVESPIEMMIHEHDTAFSLLTKIRILLNNYEWNTPNTEPVKEIKCLMKQLDDDLGLHLHLENNVLFP